MATWPFLCQIEQALGPLGFSDAAFLEQFGIEDEDASAGGKRRPGVIAATACRGERFGGRTVIGLKNAQLQADGAEDFVVPVDVAVRLLGLADQVIEQPTDLLASLS